MSTGSTFRDNQAVGGAFASVGGGIANGRGLGGGTVTVSRSTFIGNLAEGAAGSNGGPGHEDGGAAVIGVGGGHLQRLWRGPHGQGQYIHPQPGSRGRRGNGGAGGNGGGVSLNTINGARYSAAPS